MYLCIRICVFGCQTCGNIVFEVLVRFPFQKYITSWVFSGFLDVLDVLDVFDDTPLHQTLFFGFRIRLFHFNSYGDFFALGQLKYIYNEF